MVADAVADQLARAGRRRDRLSARVRRQRSRRRRVGAGGARRAAEPRRRRRLRPGGAAARARARTARASRTSSRRSARTARTRPRRRACRCCAATPADSTRCCSPAPTAPRCWSSPTTIPAMAHRVLRWRGRSNPTMRIIVRTRYIAEMEPLRAAGADRVIAEELESVVQLFADVMRSYVSSPPRSSATRPRSATADMRPCSISKAIGQRWTARSTAHANRLVRPT